MPGSLAARFVLWLQGLLRGEEGTGPSSGFGVSVSRAGAQSQPRPLRAVLPPGLPWLWCSFSELPSLPRAQRGSAVAQDCGGSESDTRNDQGGHKGSRSWVQGVGFILTHSAPLTRTPTGFRDPRPAFQARRFESKTPLSFQGAEAGAPGEGGSCLVEVLLSPSDGGAEWLGVCVKSGAVNLQARERRLPELARSF